LVINFFIIDCKRVLQRINTATHFDKIKFGLIANYFALTFIIYTSDQIIEEELRGIRSESCAHNRKQKGDPNVAIPFR
jgi:hypothetical protein